MKKVWILAMVFVMAVCGAQVYALSVDVDYDPSDPFAVASIVDHSVTGADMAGMNVIVEYLAGDQEGTWEAELGNPDAGGAYDLDVYGNVFGIPIFRAFSLYVDGDTFSADWEFDTAAFPGSFVKSLTIEAWKGNIAFDLDWNGEGTPGSASGKTFDIPGAANAHPGLVNATYMNPINIAGLDPVYDLWGTLKIDFCPPFPSFHGGIQFVADTDRFVPVPEPSTVLLLGAGLLGLIALKRKHRK